jgi:hypothetical protein
MTTPKVIETKSQSRDEKIEEILSILGELYQRFGANPMAVSAGVAVPDYKFVGYQPYLTAEMQAWARGQGAGYAPAPVLTIPTPEYMAF